MNKNEKYFPQWMRGFLLICGVYNVAWGIFIYNFPEAFIKWITQTNMASGYLVELPAVVLMILGILFIISAFYPVRFWYLLLFGSGIKLFSGIWLYYGFMNQQITKKFLLYLILNDYSWALVLIFITYRAFQLYRMPE